MMTLNNHIERQIYQSALERLAREVAAVESITEIKATERLEDMMGMNQPVATEEKKAA